MFTAYVKNSRGQTLTLTQNEADYQVIEIDGLEPPKASINMATIPYQDGGRFNGARLEPRNIVIQIRINGDVETNRLQLYDYFQTKEPCTFYYKNGSRDVFIDGYVENVDCNPFVKGEIAQISIICPDPYFKGIAQNTVTLSNSSTTTITNNSDADCGIEITATITDDPTGLLGYVSRMDFISGSNEFSVIGQMYKNDVVKVNTTAGSKSVTLTHNGATESIIGKIVEGSKWIYLAPGTNTVNYAIYGSNKNTVSVVFKWHTLYRGV